MYFGPVLGNGVLRKNTFVFPDFLTSNYLNKNKKDQVMFSAFHDVSFSGVHDQENRTNNLESFSRDGGRSENLWGQVEID